MIKEIIALVVIDLILTFLGLTAILVIANNTGLLRYAVGLLN